MHSTAQHSTASDVPSKLSVFGLCLKESAHDFVAGTVDFFTARRARESAKIADVINAKLGIEHPTPRSASALFANLAYFVAAPFHDAGTAVGEGLAAVAPAISDAIPAWASGAAAYLLPRAAMRAITPSAFQTRNPIALGEGLGGLALGAIGGASLAIGGVVGMRAPIPTIKLPKTTFVTPSLTLPPQGGGKRGKRT